MIADIRHSVGPFRIWWHSCGSNYLFTGTCGPGSTTLSNRRRYQLACRNSWRCSWPKPPIGTAAIIHIEKKRVTTRFQREEFRQHRIRNKPSKPPTCSPYRRFGDKFAFILGKSAASSQLIGTALKRRNASSSHLSKARCPTILLTSFFPTTNATARYFIVWLSAIAVASRNA